MLRIGKKINKEPQAILQKAIDFFNKKGGLKLERQSPTMVYLVGGGGHVQVTVEPSEDNKTEVDIETREWHYDVMRFLKEI